MSGVTQLTSILKCDVLYRCRSQITTSMSTLLCVTSTSHPAWQTSPILFEVLSLFIFWNGDCSHQSFRTMTAFFKLCGLYFNYQCSERGPLSLRRSLVFLSQCGCFLVPWQSIALPAAINWFCYMLSWGFRSILGEEERSDKYKSQHALSLSLSSLFIFPLLAHIVLPSDFTHYDQPATLTHCLLMLFKWWLYARCRVSWSAFYCPGLFLLFLCCSTWVPDLIHIHLYANV